MINAKKIENIIFHRECPVCDSTQLYTLGDGRILCSECQIKYNSRSIYMDSIILYSFAHDVTINKVALELNHSYNKIKDIYFQIRLAISHFLEDANLEFSGDVELGIGNVMDRYNKNSGKYLGRDRKIFAMSDLQGNIFTGILNKFNSDLPGIIKSMTVSDCHLYTFNQELYNLLEYDLPIQLIDESNSPVGKSILANFWDLLAEHMKIYRGVALDNLELYLKEFELRFIHKNNNLYQELLNIYFEPIFKQMNQHSPEKEKNEINV